MLFALALSALVRCAHADDALAKERFWDGARREIAGGATATPGAALMLVDGIVVGVAMGVGPEDSFSRGLARIYGGTYGTIAAGSLGTGGMLAIAASNRYDHGLEALGGTPEPHGPVGKGLLYAGIGVAAVGLGGTIAVDSYAGPMIELAGCGLMVGGGVVEEMEAARRRRALWYARHERGEADPLPAERPRLAMAPHAFADGKVQGVGISGVF